jgi:hypothetical protein
MDCQAGVDRNGRRLFMQWFVIGTTLLATACGRAASVDQHQRDVPGDAVKIDDVDIRSADSEIIVHYRTRTSIRDRKAQAAEMPKVWELVVKARLGDASLQRVILFPEDASLESVAIEFKKSASGQWVAVAPYSITIPAG